MITKLVIIFVCIVFYFLIKNIINYFTVRSLFENYLLWIQGSNLDFVDRKLEIVSLFKGAGIKDCIVPNVQPVGFGLVTHGTISVFNNVLVNRQDIVSLVYGMFRNSIRVYKLRIFYCINPLCWIESIVFLPKYTIDYLGFSSANLFSKIFQLIYWVMSVCFTIYISLYSSEIRNFIESW